MSERTKRRSRHPIIIPNEQIILLDKRDRISSSSTQTCTRKSFRTALQRRRSQLFYFFFALFFLFNFFLHFIVWAFIYFLTGIVVLLQVVICLKISECICI